MTASNNTSLHSHFYPQLWFLVATLMIFAVYVAWDLKLFLLIVSLDRSYMASLTMALVALMSLHCGWHIFQISRHSRHAELWLKGRAKSADSLFLQHFVDDVSVQQNEETGQSDSIMEIYADTVRAPVELGWFFVDLAIRFGLLGTIIGFILIFASLDNISIEGGDDLKELLIAMSGGMGTALYTTLTGLIGASLLSFQYLILGRQGEFFIAQLLRIRSRTKRDAASVS